MHHHSSRGCKTGTCQSWSRMFRVINWKINFLNNFYLGMINKYNYYIRQHFIYSSVTVKKWVTLQSCHLGIIRLLNHIVILLWLNIRISMHMAWRYFSSLAHNLFMIDWVNMIVKHYSSLCKWRLVMHFWNRIITVRDFCLHTLLFWI